MLSQNKKRIAYLSALTLLFSYAELFLPRFLPFFRLGLGNVAVLLSFSLDPSSFILLTVIKAVASCLMSGTLFSPFFLISFVQSVISGLFMYGIVKLFRGRLISIYGVSMLGSACSAVLQIWLSSLYLGEGTNALLGPMLLFSLFSGIVTAFLSQILHIPEEVPELIKQEKLETSAEIEKKQKTKTICMISAILVASVVIMMLKNIYMLLCALALSFAAQILSKRKIKILPHISIWLFVVISTLMMPQGEVLYSFAGWNITNGALLSGIEKAIKLSALSALSQCLASLRPAGEGILSLSLAYFGGLCKILNSSEGNLIKRTRAALSAEAIYE